MKDKKSKILTIVLVVIIVAIIGILGYLVYTAFAEKKTKENYTSAANEYEKIIASSSSGNASNITLNTLEIDTSTGDEMLDGYRIIGTIEIPAVDLKCPILEEVTKHSIEIAVAQMYTVNGLNQPGNTVIYGHNYRNTTFFSRNDELENGDSIYILDSSNVKKEYEIYNIFTTTSTDTSFYSRSSEDTGGKAEVTLSTCTDDVSTTDRRLIVMASEK